MKKKFKDRYVLGEGYPFQDSYANVSLLKKPESESEPWPDDVILKFPKSIMRDDCPKYRLVLERVK